MAVVKRVCPPNTEERWCVRVEMPDGTERHRHRGKQREALDVHRQLIAEAQAMRANAVKRPSRMTYRELVDLYLSTRNVRPRTIETYRERLAPSAAYFGDRPVSEITEEDVAVWLTQRHR